jgi:ATP-dependent Clp protease, protease subunit
MGRDNHEHIMQAPLVLGYAESYVKMSRDRAIFLSEDVSNQVGAELSALMLYYDTQDPDTEINLYIHTSGGASSGLANIYDVMQMIHAPIKTILLGKCYSAGAWILAAGTKGMRFGLRSSKVMIHGTQFTFPIPGHDLTSSKNYYEFVKWENDSLLKSLAHHTGQPLARVRQDCAQDHWMDAKAALDYGIIDHII